MEHYRIREKLEAFFDGELAPQDLKMIESHLPLCAECRSEISELKRTAQFLRFDAQPSGDFVGRVMSQIRRRQPAPGAGLWRWLYPVILGASMAVFGLVTIYPMQESESSVETLLWSESAPSTGNWLRDSNNSPDEDILDLNMEDA